MRLSRPAEPFDSDQFLFELEIDGLPRTRSPRGRQSELISINGNAFCGLLIVTCIAEPLRVESAVTDGEIGWVNDAGRPMFRDLLFRRRAVRLIAFDLLFLNGKDLRILRLIDQTIMWRKVPRRRRLRIFIWTRVEVDGTLLIEPVVKKWI